MSFRRSHLAGGSALLILLGCLWWQFAPVLQPIRAIANLSDPVKLATLGERRANRRLNQIVYWLYVADRRGVGPETAVRRAQAMNRTTEPRAALVRASLIRNFEIASRLGLFTPENLERLRRGNAGIITKGPYVGTPAEVDHIVPYSLAKEAGNELANPEIMPEPLNRRKSNHVGERQLAHARRLHDAALLSKESLARIEEAARERSSAR